MAEIPLPSLETIGKISGWVAQQANTWLKVIKSPKDFVSSIDMNSQNELGNALQFVVFILICEAILHIPLDALDLQLHVFDATTQITGFITNAIEVVLFGSLMWLFGKAMLGKGQYRNVLIAGFYSIALFPFATLAMYLSGYDRQKVLSGSFFISPDTGPVRGFVVALLALGVFVYITIKLVPLIKYIHSIGIIRALLVYCLTIAGSAAYENLIAQPFTVQLMQQGIGK